MTNSAKTVAAIVAIAALTTRKAVVHQIDLAKARIAKAEASIVTANELIVGLNAHFDTLPEQVLVSNKAYAVGETLTFNSGRGDTRKTFTGVVKAIKLKEEGKIEAYRVEVGVDFDAALFTVQPGSVIRVDGTTEDDQAEADAPVVDGAEPDADDILNDIGNA